MSQYDALSQKFINVTFLYVDVDDLSVRIDGKSFHHVTNYLF